ncbi:MAG: hypothetical protein REH83_00850 [Rickettsiella sp.]|nr:hypothetical protein [Rickettsiella sp.]
MKCPNAKCGRKIQVSDSREKDDGYKVKRRRRCHYCQETWTTYEVIQPDQINHTLINTSHINNLKESYNEIRRHLDILERSMNFIKN